MTYRFTIQALNVEIQSESLDILKLNIRANFGYYPRFTASEITGPGNRRWKVRAQTRDGAAIPFGIIEENVRVAQKVLVAC